MLSKKLIADMKVNPIDEAIKYLLFFAQIPDTTKIKITSSAYEKNMPGYPKYLKH